MRFGLAKSTGQQERARWDGEGVGGDVVEVTAEGTKRGESGARRYRSNRVASFGVERRTKAAVWREVSEG